MATRDRVRLIVAAPALAVALVLVAINAVAFLGAGALLYVAMRLAGIRLGDAARALKAYVDRRKPTPAAPVAPIVDPAVEDWPDEPTPAVEAPVEMAVDVETDLPVPEFSPSFHDCQLAAECERLNRPIARAYGNRFVWLPMTWERH